ncbi:hypothetical protein [Flavobacterium soli]|uniref:hypothetical protein n=1 Tax=Flavobacterium soli TaxID=344881 RepID=UPI00047E34AA|nr:hypothetical protein [Flavobacterium soli]
MKTLKLFIMIVAIGMATVSCGSDDGGSGVDQNNVIVGNWKYIGDLDENGFEASQYEPCDDEFMLFNGNGSFKLTYNYCGEETEIYQGQWRKLGEANMYRFSLDGLTDEYKIIFSENNTRLTLYEEEFEGGFYASVYEKQ